MGPVICFTMMMSRHAVSEPVYYRYLYKPNDYTVPEAAVCSTIMLAIHAVSLRAHVRRACNIVEHATGPMTVLWLGSPVSYCSSMDLIVQTAWWAQSSYNPPKYSMVHKIAIPPCIPRARDVEVALWAHYYTVPGSVVRFTILPSPLKAAL